MLFTITNEKENLMKKLLFPYLLYSIILIWIAPISTMAQNISSQDKLPFALSEIRPVGNNMKASTLIHNDKVKFSLNFTTWHSKNGKKFVVKGKTSLTTQDNSVMGAGIGDIAITISGTELLKLIPESKNTINSSFTVWQNESGGFVLSTIYPDDEFYFKLIGQRFKLIYPFGDGARIFFKGKVVNFFEGYTFDGNLEIPLCFELSSKTGLTYKSGADRVLKGTKIIKIFD